MTTLAFLQGPLPVEAPPVQPVVVALSRAAGLRPSIHAHCPWSYDPFLVILDDDDDGDDDLDKEGPSRCPPNHTLLVLDSRSALFRPPTGAQIGAPAWDLAHLPSLFALCQLRI